MRSELSPRYGKRQETIGVAVLVGSGGGDGHTRRWRQTGLGWNGLDWSGHSGVRWGKAKRRGRSGEATGSGAVVGRQCFRSGQIQCLNCT